MQGKPDTKTLTVKTLVLAISVLAPVQALADNRATLVGGQYTIALNERATFPVTTSKDHATEFSAWCDLTSAGSASVVVDGRHYVPLSEPAIGDVVTFNGAGNRRFEMTGTFQANSGDAEISFYFASVPVAFCFGGGDCASVGQGSSAISVSCGHY